MQEQGPDSSSFDNDLVDAGNSPIVDAHTADSPIRYNLMVRESYAWPIPPAINMNKNLSLPLQIPAPEI